MKAPHCYSQSHGILDHTATVTFLPLPQLKLVLNSATMEGCKAEFTWWWLYAKIAYPPKTATYLRNNQAVS